LEGHQVGHVRWFLVPGMVVIGTKSIAEIVGGGVGQRGGFSKESG
jgi:hypothetical protein